MLDMFVLTYLSHLVADLVRSQTASLCQQDTVVVPLRVIRTPWHPIIILIRPEPKRVRVWC